MRSVRRDPPFVSGCLVLALAMLGCGTDQRGRDASIQLSRQVSEISVRIDAPSGGAPSVSVLAFRAQTAGIAAGDVLSVVDPLVAAPPEGRCELRDVAGAARTLKAQGGAVDLEELEGVVVDLGSAGQPLRPAPRVYPQLTAAIGGVIAEAGPVLVPTLPDALTLALASPEGDAAHVALTVPLIPRLLDADGSALVSGGLLAPRGDLIIAVSGPGRSFVEIRPFGSTLALACPAGPSGRVVVARDLVDRLRAGSGQVPVSFEAVWRDSRLVAGASQSIRISLEARSSAVLELQP